MKWSEYAIDSLKKHISRQTALMNLGDRIKELDTEFKSTKGPVTDRVPVKGGSSKNEDRLLNNIVERDELIQNYNAVERAVNRVERALGALTERQRRVLDGFYIFRTDDYMDRLCDDLHVEIAQVYRLKDEALKKFTLALYGTIEN